MGGSGDGKTLQKWCSVSIVSIVDYFRMVVSIERYMSILPVTVPSPVDINCRHDSSFPALPASRLRTGQYCYTAHPRERLFPSWLYTCGSGPSRPLYP